MADGDSMPPFADGTYVIGEYVEQLEDLKKGKGYMFITLEGYTFKTFVKRNKKTLTVAADNTFYDAYDISLTDIVQVWRYVRGILPQDYKPHYLPDHTNLSELVNEAKRSGRRCYQQRDLLCYDSNEWFQYCLGISSRSGSCRTTTKNGA